MFPLKRILGLFVLVVIFYGLLSAPWPGVIQAYAVCFRAVGDLVFGSFGAENAVRFEPLPDARGAADTSLVLCNPKSGAVADASLSSRLMGYVPTAVLVSLVLATPLAWARKGRALLWGLVLVNGFVALRVGIMLLRYFSQDDPLRLFDLGPCMRTVLDWAVRAGVNSTGSQYGVPVLIWILVAFRRGDWLSIFAAPPPGDSTSPAGPPG